VIIRVDFIYLNCQYRYAQVRASKEVLNQFILTSGCRKCSDEFYVKKSPTSKTDNTNEIYIYIVAHYRA
jgi:hypothetical protein